MRIAVIICAAGRSERFAPGTAKNKLEQDLDGRPVLLRSTEALANRDEVSTLIVAVDPDRVDEVRLRYGDALAIRGAKIVSGGRIARWETVKSALQHLPGDCTHIAVHDAARPCISPSMLGRLIEAAAVFDAVIPGVQVPDTLKRAGADVESAARDDDIASSIIGDAGATNTSARRVIETVSRENLYAIQTPQIFRRELLERAYTQDNLDSTDDAMLIERLGEPVRIVEGDPFNIKITTEGDLHLARAILKIQQRQQSSAAALGF